MYFFHCQSKKIKVISNSSSTKVFVPEDCMKRNTEELIKNMVTYIIKCVLGLAPIEACTQQMQYYYVTRMICLDIFHIIP